MSNEITKPSGLKIEIHTEGSGEKPKSGQILLIN